MTTETSAHASAHGGGHGHHESIPIVPGQILMNPKWKLIEAGDGDGGEADISDDSEEDISDEAVERAHTAHLEQMKARMELYQSLKKEAGRGGGGGNR